MLTSTPTYIKKDRVQPSLPSPSPPKTPNPRKNPPLAYHHSYLTKTLPCAQGDSVTGEEVSIY